MILYYSGALEVNAAQPAIKLSLGGYISSSQVPNDELNAVLSGISQLTIDTKGRETFLLVLKNTLSEPIENLRIWFNYPTEEDVNVSKVVLNLAAVAPSVDSCDNPIFEKINSLSGLPVHATFTEPSSEDEAIEAGDIAVGSYIGIWFKKTINTANTAQLTCAELNTNFEDEVTLPDSQTIVLNISYDLDVSDSV